MSTNISVGKTLLEKGYLLVASKESFCEHFNHFGLVYLVKKVSPFMIIHDLIRFMFSCHRTM